MDSPLTVKGIHLLPESIQAAASEEAQQWLSEITTSITTAVPSGEWETVTTALKRLETCESLRFVIPPATVKTILECLLPIMMEPDVVPAWHFFTWTTTLVMFLRKGHDLKLAVNWAVFDENVRLRIPRKSTLFDVPTGRASVLQSVLQLVLELQRHKSGDDIALHALTEFRTQICPHFPGDSALALLKLMASFPVSGCSDELASTFVQNVLTISVWNLSTRWRSAALTVLLRLAKSRPTFDWSPYVESVYHLLLQSFHIPAGCGDLGYPKFSTSNSFGLFVEEGDVVAGMAVSMLSNNVDAPAWKCLETLLRSTDVLYFIGGRTQASQLADFLSSLTKFLHMRLRKQRKFHYPPSAQLHAPELNRFCTILMPTVMLCFECKHGVARHGALCLRRMASVAPELTFNAFLSKVEALDFVTDPTSMNALLETLTEVVGRGISAQIHDVFTVMPRFLQLIVEGINTNNAKQTISSLAAIRTLVIRLPLTTKLDLSHVPAAVREKYSHLPYGLEEWFCSVVNRILEFARSYTESKLSHEIERDIRVTVMHLFSAVQDDMHKALHSTLLSFVCNNMCIPTRKIVGNLIAYSLDCQSPAWTERCLRVLHQHAFGEKTQLSMSDVKWYGYLYARCLARCGETLLPYVHIVKATIHRLMDTAQEKWQAKAAGKLLIGALKGLTDVRPKESSHANVGSTEFFQPSSWGQYYHEKDITISWYIPCDEAIAVARELSSSVFEWIQQKVNDFFLDSTRKEDEGGASVFHALVLLRYLVHGASLMISDAPYKASAAVSFDFAHMPACFSMRNVVEICQKVLTGRDRVGVKSLKMVCRILTVLMSSRGGMTKKKLDRQLNQITRLRDISTTPLGLGLRTYWVLKAHTSLLARYVSVPYLPHDEIVLSASQMLFHLSTGLFSAVRKKAQSSMGSIARLYRRSARREQVTQWLQLMSSSEVKEEIVTGVCHLMQLPVYLTAFSEEQDLVRDLMKVVLLAPTFDRVTVQARIQAAFSILLKHLWEVEVHNDAELQECIRFTEYLSRTVTSDSSWQFHERALRFALHFIRSKSPWRPPIDVSAHVSGLTLSSLVHPSPHVMSCALDGCIKLFNIHKTTPVRKVLEYSSEDPNRPLVDRPCLGFFDTPTTVYTFDYTAPPETTTYKFVPSDATKAQFTILAQETLRPHLLNTYVEHRALDAKSVAYSNRQARVWKGIFRAIRTEGIREWTTQILNKIIEEGCANNTATSASSVEATAKADGLNLCRRGYLSCACEILSGLFRATRHWSVEERDKTEELVVDYLEQIIVRAPQETVSDITAAIHFAVFDIDTRRYPKLQRSILERRFFESDDTTIIVRRRLQIAEQLINIMSWRARGTALHLIEYIKQHGMTQPYNNVRFSTAALLATCMEIMWDPKCPGHRVPQIDEFFTDLAASVASTDATVSEKEAKHILAKWETVFLTSQLILNRGSSYAIGAQNCHVLMSAVISYVNIERSVLSCDELTSITSSILHKLMHSEFPKEDAETIIEGALQILATVDQTAATPLLTKGSKIALLFFLEGFTFANQFRCCYHQYALLEKVVNGCAQLLNDKHKSVRVRASDALSFLFRIQSLPYVANQSFRFLAMIKTPATRMEGVMGLRSVVLAYPETIPEFVPGALVGLGRYHGDRGVEVSAAVKDTFASWWRAHNAAWQNSSQKDAFTEEQREVLSELVYSTNYFV